MSRKKATATPELNGLKSFQDAGAFHRATRKFASTNIGAAVFRPTSHHLDKLVDSLSGGRLSFVGLAAGLPVVLLTTTGARSHAPRTVPVIGFPYDDGLALIASNFGGARHPGWYHNLKAMPEATVAIGGATWEAFARPATPRERDEIWAKGVAIYPAYDDYKGQPGAGRSRLSSFPGVEPRPVWRKPSAATAHKST